MVFPLDLNCIQIFLIFNSVFLVKPIVSEVQFIHLGSHLLFNFFYLCFSTSLYISEILLSRYHLVT